MKTLQQWFDEYAVSHQNQTNKKIHYICVPLIFFSIVGLLMSIPVKFIPYYFDHQSLLFNWATVALIFIMVFYWRLSKRIAFYMLLFSIICIIANDLIAQLTSLWLVSLLLFAGAWIGQFYGHEVEGKKPSFLKDLQFLLIGPAWVMNHWFKRK